MDTPVEAVKAVEVLITTEEKLAGREIELTFLRGQAQLQVLAKQVEDAQKAFGKHVEALAAKYKVEATHLYDIVSASFKPRV